MIRDMAQLAQPLLIKRQAGNHLVLAERCECLWTQRWLPEH